MADYGNMLNALSGKLLVDVENYGIWKHEVQNIMLLYDLWKFVDGSAIRHPSDARAQADYDRKSQAALAFLNLSVSWNIIDDIQDAKTPKEFWDAIVSLYERRSGRRLLELLDQLKGLELSGPVADHLRIIREIRSQIRATERDFSDALLISLALNTLPAPYAEFACLTRLNFEKITFISFEESLLDWEERLRRSQEEDEEATQASVVEHKGKGSNGSICCRYCGLRGHLERNCRKKQRESQRW